MKYVGMNYFDFVEEMENIKAKFLSTEHEVDDKTIRFVDHYNLGEGRGLSVIVEHDLGSGNVGAVTAAEYFDMEDYGG